MKRINLGKPYDDFIERMINSGYYSTATEVIRDALRDKMDRVNKDDIAHLHALIKEGLDDIEAGRVIEYDEHFWDKIMERAKTKRENNEPIPEHIRP